MVPITAERVRLIREQMGCGILEGRRAMEMALTPEFRGDVMLALAYIDQNATAVFIKGDRHAAMLGRAARTAARFRATYPILDREFPKPEELAP